MLCFPSLRNTICQINIYAEGNSSDSQDVHWSDSGHISDFTISVIFIGSIVLLILIAICCIKCVSFYGDSEKLEKFRKESTVRKSTIMMVNILHRKGRRTADKSKMKYRQRDETDLDRADTTKKKISHSVVDSNSSFVTDVNEQKIICVDDEVQQDNKNGMSTAMNLTPIRDMNTPRFDRDEGSNPVPQPPMVLNLPDIGNLGRNGEKSMDIDEDEESMENDGDGGDKEQDSEIIDDEETLGIDLGDFVETTKGDDGVENVDKIADETTQREENTDIEQTQENVQPMEVHNGQEDNNEKKDGNENVRNDEDENKDKDDQDKEYDSNDSDGYYPYKYVVEKETSFYGMKNIETES